MKKKAHNLKQTKPGWIYRDRDGSLALRQHKGAAMPWLYLCREGSSWEVYDYSDEYPMTAVARTRKGS
jgi:hypothetical protein